MNDVNDPYDVVRARMDARARARDNPGEPVAVYECRNGDFVVQIAAAVPPKDSKLVYTVEIQRSGAMDHSFRKRLF